MFGNVDAPEDGAIGDSTIGDSMDEDGTIGNGRDGNGSMIMAPDGQEEDDDAEAARGRRIASRL